MAEEFVPGANVGNVAGYIKSQIDAGVNATNALANFRSDGGAIRRQTWFQMFGEVNDALNRSGAAAALDPFQLPDVNAYSTWSINHAPAYATNVTVFSADYQSGATGQFRYTYMTAEPHTPAEAELAAFSEYSAAENREIGATGEGLTPLGTMTTNVFQVVPIQ